jgi:capsular exopolysaccharide synthesis family protein
VSAREFPVGLGERDLRGHRQLGLNDVVRLLWRRRAVVAGTVALLTSLFTLLAFTLPPQYTAIATILVQGQDPLVLSMENVTSNAAPDKQEMATNIQLLTADSFVLGIVKAFELEKDAEFNPILPGGPRVWDWFDDKIRLIFPRSAPGAEQDQRESAVVVLKDQILVEQSGDAHTLSIRVTSHDPDKAAQIANAFAVRFITDRLEAKRQAISQAATWLNERLTDLRKQVSDSEGAVASYFGEQGLSAQREDNSVLRQLDQLNIQLALAETRRAQAEGRLQGARQVRRSSGQVQAAANMFTSPHIVELRAQEALLERQLAEGATRYGPQHPTLLNVQAQLDALRARKAAETGRIFGEIEQELTVARAEEDQLRERVGQLQQMAREQQTAAVPGMELQRQADVDRSMYTTFLTRYKEVSDQLDLASPGVEVVSEARKPTAPSFPRKMLMIAGSFVGSLLIGFILAFLFEVLDSGLRSAQQVEEALGVPTLAMVPKINSGKGRSRSGLNQYLRANPRSRFSDAIRSLKLEISQSNLDQPPKVVLLTSALPGEGKTSLALCLATAAAEEGLRTVIIDLDLHRPRLRRAFGGAEGQPGIVELVSNEYALEQALVADGTTPGLFAITVNRSTANPSALFGTKRMAELIKSLRDRFDIIFLDTPPTLAVGDARVLARLADALVFVVRWGSTRVDAGRAGIEKLFDLPTPIVGAVVNQVDVKRHAQRSYGDALQYYRKYEHYYRD